MKNKNIPALLVFIAAPLALFASSATDRKIEDAAKSSYNYQTVLEDHVKVKAKDGVVTLTGTVQDNDEKALAADTVENLPGVLNVRNEIKVKADYPEKSDGWIAFKIRSRLLVKGNVSATSTKVSSQDGVVTLSGTADSQAQKDLTEAYAKDIDGVKSVQNEIVVQDKLASDSNHKDSDGYRRDSMGDKMDDASITSQVKYALLSHKGTSAIKTKVTTNDGSIVITGVAANDAEKSLVTKLASDVRGVRSVSNNMTVTKS
jgi:osmotically-inducible protein OsmY